MGGAAELGDERRTKQLVRLLGGLATHPVGSLPMRLRKHDLKAAYRLCAHEAVTLTAIVQAIQEGARSLIDETPGDILFLHDTTELNFFIRFSLHGQLGPVGNGTGRGYLCHSCVAITSSGQMLGVLQQILHLRVPVPKGDTYGKKRDRKTRESLLWLRGLLCLLP